MSNNNFKETQQDLTEWNGDGNRERGRYGEDESQLTPSENKEPREKKKEE